MYIHSGALVQKEVQINLELYLVDWLLEVVFLKLFSEYYRIEQMNQYIELSQWNKGDTNKE